MKFDFSISFLFPLLIRWTNFIHEKEANKVQKHQVLYITNWYDLDDGGGGDGGDDGV